jgi:cardiolipin synthase
MASNILTIPNLVTCLRMALIPVFASLLFYGYNRWALFVFLVAGISDGIDGFVARRFNQESELGTIIDPIADKLLMTVAFIVLAMKNILPETRFLPVPFWVTAAVIGRDVLIVTILVAASFGTSFYLPTVYFIVVLLAVVSGIHYIFHVAKLMKEAEKTETDPAPK